MKVVGLDTLSLDPGKGTLFLPNHPAQIEPIILELLLYDRYRPRPLVDEYFYYQPAALPLMHLVKALPLASMGETANRWRAMQVEKQFQAIVEGLKRRENFLIYPGGRLKISGWEILGGSSFVYRLMQAMPDCNVVLVRTEGLWGSQFSRALTGKTPHFFAMLWKGAKIVLGNGIFFTPRRQLTITFSSLPADVPKQGTKLEFNRYLEQWYNRYPQPGPEPLTLIRTYFWKKKVPTPFVPLPKESKQARKIPIAIEKKVFEYLAGLSGKPMSHIFHEQRLSEDLGLDSLDSLQIALFIEEEFSDAAPVSQMLMTVQDVLEAAMGDLEQPTSTEEEIAPFKAKGRRTAPHSPLGRTIQESLVRVCKKRWKEIACVDRTSGSLRYRDVLRAVLALKEAIQTLPEEKVGVLLPASTAAYLVIFAILFAKKVPVMLNWTVGVRAIDHAVDLTQLKTVISSSRFLDKLESIHLGKIEGSLLYVEEIKRSLRWKDQVKVLWQSFFSAEKLMKRFQYQAISPQDIAVILFTSGTETLPKGVPLSHANLLTNQTATLKSVVLKQDEFLFGMLPPFHSFGFSMTGLLPFLAGMKACFSPDPTASHRLAQEIAYWKPTLLAAAPSFIKALFRAAKEGELTSLRYIVSGAERTPQALFEYVKIHLPQAELLEGYGITECGPVVTLQRQGAPHIGVGKPVPGVEIRIVDPESGRVVSQGLEGEVCIFGENVFSGYLGNPRDPFLELEGKKWYRSGDRGMLTSEGDLVLTGRLKRFIKIGGEMVSLSGLEEDLVHVAHKLGWVPQTDEGPLLAVSVRERESKKPQIILYATFEVAVSAVNDALQELGYGRLIKVFEVKRIDAIPLTGTGKTHYRLLDELNE